MAKAVRERSEENFILTVNKNINEQTVPAQQVSVWTFHYKSKQYCVAISQGNSPAFFFVGDKIQNQTAAAAAATKYTRRGSKRWCDVVIHSLCTKFSPVCSFFASPILADALLGFGFCWCAQQKGSLWNQCANTFFRVDGVVIINGSTNVVNSVHCCCMLSIIIEWMKTASSCMNLYMYLSLQQYNYLHL